MGSIILGFGKPGKDEEEDEKKSSYSSEGSDGNDKKKELLKASFRDLKKALEKDDEDMGAQALEALLECAE